MEYQQVKDLVSEIIEIGDEAKASTKIIELNDMMTKAEAEDKANLDNLNNQIEAQQNRINELEADNKTIRENNSELMLKYGEMLTQQQPQFKKVEEPEEDKELSWNEIAQMD